MVLELIVTMLALALTGAGAASLLTPLSRDVQAALAIPLGWALVAATTPLIDTGIPPRLLTAATVVAGAALSVVRARAVLPMGRAAGWPAVVVAATLLVSAGPALDRGTWAAETYGNADPYLWVSQARALVDGAAVVGASHPDLLAAERLDTQHWGEATPVGLAALAGATGRDPAFVVFLLIAALSVVAPLVTYAAARVVLGLPVWVATVAGVVTGVAALQQLAVVGSWIPQLGGASLALAAGVLLRAAYDAGGSRRLEVAAALCVAGALATYRLPVSGILAVMLGVAFASAVVEKRRPLLRPTARFGAAALVLAAPSLLELSRGLGAFVDRQLSEADWDKVVRVRPWEGVGMTPRNPRLGLLESQWSYLPSVVAIVVLIIGVIAIRRRAGGSFALLGLGVGVTGAVLLPLAGASPYLSFKLVGYTAPFAILVAVVPLHALREARPVRIVYAVGAFLLVAGTLSFGDKHWRHTGLGSISELQAVAAEASELADGGGIEIAVGIPRAEAWLVYFLRDRPVSLPCPSAYFTGIGLDVDRTRYLRPSAVSIVIDDGRPLLWSRGDFGLVTAPAPNPVLCDTAPPAELSEAAGGSAS